MGDGLTPAAGSGGWRWGGQDQSDRMWGSHHGAVNLTSSPRKDFQVEITPSPAWPHHDDSDDQRR